MLTEALLKEIGIKEEDIGLILEQNEIYGDKILPLAAEYQKNLADQPFVAFTDEESAVAHAEGAEYVKSVVALDAENDYLMQLLAWLHLVPEYKKKCEELEIEPEIFRSTMRDIAYKIEECKTVKGCLGVFVDFFFLNFAFKLFEIGRLQFHCYTYGSADYSFGDTVIKKGDVIFYCHIPSSGKLTPELCMDSLQSAYEFFEKRGKIEGDVMRIFCSSWLLYTPYVKELFPEGSNLRKFAEMFDVFLDSKREDFSAGWRIFGKIYEGTTKGLPSDTTLRRNFIKYIDEGKSFGDGYGVILYDGKQKKIINKK